MKTVVIVFAFASLLAFANAQTAPTLPNSAALEATLTFLSPTVAGPAGSNLITGHLYVILSIEQQMERFRLSMPATRGMIFEGVVDYANGTVYSLNIIDGQTTCQVFTGIDLPRLVPNFIEEYCTFVWPAEAEGQPADQWICNHGVLSGGPQVNMLTTPLSILGETVTVEGPAGLVEFITFTSVQEVGAFPPDAFAIPSACKDSARRSARSAQHMHEVFAAALAAI